MYDFILSPLARRDVANITSHTYIKYGNAQVEKYTALLYSHIQKVADGLIEGRARSGLPQEYLTINAEKHVIIYKIDGDLVRIARILHQKMDISRHRLH